MQAPFLLVRCKHLGTRQYHQWEIQEIISGRSKNDTASILTGILQFFNQTEQRDYLLKRINHPIVLDIEDGVLKAPGAIVHLTVEEQPQGRKLRSKLRSIAYTFIYIKFLLD